MARTNTLRSLFALPLAALLATGAVACGGSASDGTEGAQGVEQEAQQGQPGAATTASAGEGANPTTEFTADDPANAPASGSESQDEGYAESLTDAPLALDTTADDPGEGDGTAQTSDALLSTRGAILRDEARRENGFINRPTSYYTHTTYVNETTGTRQTDCSGFLGYGLNRVLKDAYAKVPHPNTYKPLANDWYSYLSTRYTSASTQSTPRWRRIVKAVDLKPGDVIAWLTPIGVVSENTGHVMVVNGYPKAGRSDKNEILIPIVDSTRAPHASDSRGSSMTGIGTGTIGVKVDSYGKATAYYWRGGESYNAYSTKIAFGRVE